MEWLSVGEVNNKRFLFCIEKALLASSGMIVPFVAPVCCKKKKKKKKKPSSL